MSGIEISTLHPPDSPHVTLDPKDSNFEKRQEVVERYWGNGGMSFFRISVDPTRKNLVKKKDDAFFPPQSIASEKKPDIYFKASNPRFPDFYERLKRSQRCRFFSVPHVN